MGLEIVRRIRGNINSSIDVTALEDAVIAHPYVQRLRRIKQLAFLHYVFPGATHSRFEHSLGVMQLAGLAWDKLKTNQERLSTSLRRFPEFARLEKTGATGKRRHGLLAPTFPLLQQVFGSDYNLQLIRLAGLMHDLGHPPFSHSGELFLPSWSDVLEANQDAADYIIDYLKQNIERVKSSGRDPREVRVRHEVYSLLLADRVLRDVQESHPDLSPQIDPRDLASVIIPEIKPHVNSPILVYGVNRLLNELISGELDIDRMDYLQRDSHECGVVYGIFDHSRIMDSLLVYFDEADSGLHVAINFSGLAAFEDYLRARFSMYLQVYFHKTAVAAEAMMQHLGRKLGNFRYQAARENYAELDEISIGPVLREAGKKKLGDGIEFAEYNRVVRDLLMDRRLWKRVFEEAGRGDSKVSDARVNKARKIIEGMGADYELISTANSLTRFHPRKEDEDSRNYLRLVKKGPRQFPTVTPIEDHLSVVHENERSYIHRLYVANQKDFDGKLIGDAVKQKIFEQLK